MKRPSEVDVVEVWQHPDGTIEWWADVNGAVVALEAPAAAVANRAAIYGLEPDSEELLRILTAEHLDSFEQHFAQTGDDMTKRAWAPRYKDEKRDKSVKRLSHLEKKHPIPKRSR